MSGSALSADAIGQAPLQITKQVYSYNNINNNNRIGTWKQMLQHHLGMLKTIILGFLEDYVSNLSENFMLRYFLSIFSR